MATFNPENVLLMNAKDGNIPTEYSTFIMKDVIDNSIITQFGRYEAMTKPKKVFNYLAEGPGAYWVNEAEKIQTSKATWLQITMEAKKLAVIIPVSKEFLKWTQADFFNMIKPKISEAFRKKFDAAAIFGVDSPYGEGLSIYERAKTAENMVTLGTGSVYEDINTAMALVEDGDNEPQALATTRSFNKDLRGALDGRNLPIFNDAHDGVTASVLGMPVAYGSKGAWDKEKAIAITGDFDNAVYGILQDMEYSISEDATLTTVQGEDGEPINLFERDMFALRATMHIAFMTVKDDAFAVIEPAKEEPGA